MYKKLTYRFNYINYKMYFEIQFYYRKPIVFILQELLLGMLLNIMFFIKTYLSKYRQKSVSFLASTILCKT